MNKKHLLLIIFTISSLIFTSCGKYDEGPQFSLISKNKRIAQKWIIKHVEDVKTGEVHSSEFDGFTLTITKNLMYTREFSYFGKVTSEQGTWAFEGDTFINFRHEENGVYIDERYKIIRLSKKDFWIRNSVDEIHYMVD